MKEQFEKKAYSPTMKSGVDDVSKPYHWLLMSILDGQSPHVSREQAFETMVMREAIHQVGEEKAKMLLEYCEQMEENSKVAFQEKLTLGANNID